MDFVITAMPTAVADSFRAGTASGGAAPRRVVLTEAGAPCRHCLQPGQVGEEMLLGSYQPFAGDSPYAVPSPVFVHAGPCPPYPATDRIPALVRDGVRAVRSYDAAHDLLEGDVAPGTAIEPLIDRLLADERADYLHVYSATAGCFTCRVDRA
jgi:hypothetical protein